MLMDLKKSWFDSGDIISSDNTKLKNYKDSLKISNINLLELFVWHLWMVLFYHFFCDFSQSLLLEDITVKYIPRDKENLTL